jgi:hypothetical protein
MNVHPILALAVVCFYLITPDAYAIELACSSDATRQELDEISAAVGTFQAKHNIPGVSIAFLRNGHQQ